jgi:hypothetical protein
MKEIKEMVAYKVVTNHWYPEVKLLGEGKTLFNLLLLKKRCKHIKG